MLAWASYALQRTCNARVPSFVQYVVPCILNGTALYFELWHKPPFLNEKIADRYHVALFVRKSILCPLVLRCGSSGHTSLTCGSVPGHPYPDSQSLLISSDIVLFILCSFFMLDSMTFLSLRNGHLVSSQDLDIDSMYPDNVTSGVWHS